VHQTELDLLRTRARLRKVLQARRDLRYSSNSDSDQDRDGLRVTRDVKTQVRPYTKDFRDVKTQVHPYTKDFYCQVYPTHKVLHDVAVQTEPAICCIVENIPQTENMIICGDVIAESQHLPLSPIIVRKTDHNEIEMLTQSPPVLTPETINHSVPMEMLSDAPPVLRAETLNPLVPVEMLSDATPVLRGETINPSVPDYVNEEIVVEETDYIAQHGSEEKVVQETDSAPTTATAIIPSQSSGTFHRPVRPSGTTSYPILPVFDAEDTDNQLLKVMDIFKKNIDKYLLQVIDI
jgi:hypothetical protein